MIDSKGPKVDIILPNYNSYKFIESTIKSIIKQSYQNWKLIIVEDASEIKTKKILRKFLKNKRIKIFWLKIYWTHFLLVVPTSNSS